MRRYENPVVLATRPKPDSERFLALLKEAAGPFQGIIAPAFDYQTKTTEIPPFEVAIFTSRIGVLHAPTGQGRVAYCVGGATAQAAQDAGYQSISANGDVNDLIALILDDRPMQTLLHVRGETSVGDVTTRLSSAGLTCQDIITYTKQKCALDPALRELITQGPICVLPLFSGETVSIFEEWDLPQSNLDAEVVDDTPDAPEAETPAPLPAEEPKSSFTPPFIG